MTNFEVEQCNESSHVPTKPLTILEPQNRFLDGVESNNQRVWGCKMLGRARKLVKQSRKIAGRMGNINGLVGNHNLGGKPLLCTGWCTQIIRPSPWVVLQSRGIKLHQRVVQCSHLNKSVDIVVARGPSYCYSFLSLSLVLFVDASRSV